VSYSHGAEAVDFERLGRTRLIAQADNECDGNCGHGDGQTRLRDDAPERPWRRRLRLQTAREICPQVNGNGAAPGIQRSKRALLRGQLAAALLAIVQMV
jgi:hypothetical protein